jgi:hypothetical protein
VWREAGRDDVRSMIIGVLGCNLAWGIIGVVLYLMVCLAEKGSSLATSRAMRVSNAIAVAMLFLTGFAYGRFVGRSPWLVDLSILHFAASAAWIG